jgi:hypothetical protein
METNVNFEDFIKLGLMIFTPMIPDLEKYYDTFDDYEKLKEITVTVPVGIRKHINGKAYIHDVGTILVPFPIVETADNAHLAGEEDHGLDNYVWENLKNKKIIEFNGDYWHRNPEIYGPDFFSGNLYDKHKNTIATNNGFEIMIVWEKDFKQNKELIIQECINFLDGNRTNG